MLVEVMSMGTPYIVAAASGAGKTSLVRGLLGTLPDLTLSVSHTTRKPRPGERDGVDYHFVGHGEFQTMVARDEFLEHARVFDHYYGTSRTVVQESLRSGRDVILEIDWQGARQVRQTLAGCVGIFILPPSRQILLERLRNRGQDSEEVISRRMRDAVAEISHYAEFDYLIVNAEFDRALAELQSIICAGRLARPVQVERLRTLLNELLKTDS